VNAGGTLFPEHNRIVQKAWVALANVYADLGTWWCITPFIGAGVGVAKVRLSGFTDTVTASLNPVTGATLINANNFAADNDQWNFAWAVHAGLAYRVTPGFTVELAYRYLNLGDGITGSPILGFDSTVRGSHFELKNIDSHDLKLGVRWQCCEDIPAPPPPMVVRKG
jgi:opacity protein-like surface antigen